MGLEAASWINELIASNPPGGDKKKQGDDHLRMIKLVLQNSFPNASTGRPFRFATSTSLAVDSSITNTSDNALIVLNQGGAARTLTLPDALTVWPGWQCFLLPDGATAFPWFIQGFAGATVNGLTKVRRSIASLLTHVFWTGGQWIATRPNGGMIGETKCWNAAALPNGHLWADGTAINAALWPELNGTLIGGGLLPDRRGRTGVCVDAFPSGAAAGRLPSLGGGASSLWAAGGEDTHTLGIFEIPVLTPSGVVVVSATIHAPFQSNLAFAGAGGSQVCVNGATDTTGVITADINSGNPIPLAMNTINLGAGQSHNNLQPFLVERYIVVGE